MIDKVFVESQFSQKTINPEEIRINCPECQDDKFHMYCNLKKLVYICHRCGAKGKIRSEIQSCVEEYKRLDIVEQKIFYKPKYLSNKDIVKNLPRNKCINRAKEHDLPLAYLFERGLSFEDIRRYDIRVSEEKHGPISNTIIFPIYEDELKNKLKYFVCRKYDNTNPKYVNAPWPKEDTLFIACPDTTGVFTSYVTVIVEGIFDAISIAKCGYRSIALLGKIPTPQQLHRLSSSSYNKFLIYLDHDAFDHAIDLKLKLSALNKKAELIIEKHDANDLYLNKHVSDCLSSALNHYAKSL